MQSEITEESSNLEEPLLDVQQGNDENDENNDQEEEEDSLSFTKLLFYRAIYFLNGLSASTWGRFGIIYYNKVKHLSPEQIGVLQGVTPFISFVTQPIWGLTSDMLKSKKQVYLFCKGLNTVALLCLSLKSVNSFPRVLLCVAVMAVFRASGVLDSHTLDFLGEKHRSAYGSIRLWTAVSWGLGAVIMGWITDRFGFEYNFILFGTMMFCVLCVVAFGLPAKTKAEQAMIDNNNRLGSRHDYPRSKSLVRALCRANVLFWLLQVCIIGAGMGLVDSFLFVFLQNDLQASTRLCGFTVGITVLFELPIFHYSKFLLKRWGHDVLFILSMLAYAIRVICYTLLTPSTVHYVLALEILHGITFASMWIASIDFAAAVAPPEWSATVQTILSTCLSCVGGGLGPIVGGWVLQTWGAVFMYRGAGYIVLATLVVHIFMWIITGRAPHDGFLKRIKEQNENGDDSENEALRDGEGQREPGDDNSEENMLMTANDNEEDNDPVVVQV